MKDIRARADKALLEHEYFQLVGNVVSFATTCAFTGFSKADKEKLYQAVSALAQFEKDHEL